MYNLELARIAVICLSIQKLRFLLKTFYITFIGLFVIGHALYCFNCFDCATHPLIRLDCSLLYNSTHCYMSTDTDGKGLYKRLKAT